MSSSGERGREAPLARVLVVEDSTLFRRMVIRVLEAEGYRAEGAATMATAVTRFSAVSFDLLISDVGVLGDGAELAAVETNPPPRVLLMSSGPWDGLTMSSVGRKWGFLLKPCSIDELVLAVRRLLES